MAYKAVSERDSYKPEGLWKIIPETACAHCGKPTIIYSIEFHAPLHIECHDKMRKESNK